jgi:tryptophan synthase beta chain
MDAKRALLSEQDIPSAWYNLQADLPEPVPPPLHPGTHQPLSPTELEPIFARALIEQEISRERWIEIPDPVRRVLTIWRPTPLVRATELEKALKTPARIYFKDESHSPPGSHKPNTAVAQAYYNKLEGIEQLTTETGAGQWGTALAFACAQFGVQCKVFMVKVSYIQKPYRRTMMQIWGGQVIASPSTETAAGRQILAADPDCPGSLGIAISEAVEAAVTQVHAGQRAEPRPAAPDGGRPGGGTADGAVRGFSRRGRGVRGGRKQLFRPGIPIPPAQVEVGESHPLYRLRAVFLPVDEPGRVSLRLR